MPMGQRTLLPDAGEFVLDTLKVQGRPLLCMVPRAAGMRTLCRSAKGRHPACRGCRQSCVE
jgi:hypothetical protein